MKDYLDLQSELVRASIEEQMAFSDTTSESASGSNYSQKQRNDVQRCSEELIKMSFGELGIEEISQHKELRSGKIEIETNR